MIYPTPHWKIPSIIYLVILGLVALNSCQKSPEPDIILQRCIDAVFAGDYKKAYEYFCFDDRSVMGAAEFIKEHTPTAEDLTIKELIADRISYRFEGVTQGEDTTIVSLSMVIPHHMVAELDFIFSDLVITDTTDSVFSSTLQNYIYLGQVRARATLVKDLEGWRVCGSWEMILKAEAQAANERYDYLTRIKIRGIKVYGSRGDEGAYLTALIHNTGTRTLGAVEVMVVCFSKSGTPRYSVEVYPISADDRPLKPTEKRRFKVDLTSAPADWAKTVDIKVTNCWFSE